MQIVGIYALDSLRILPIVEHFRDAQLSVPTIFGLDRDESLSNIAIYPALYSVDRTTTIPQLLTKSLSKDSGVNSGLDQFHILKVSCINPSDMSIIRALAKGMAGGFPQIRCLTFIFEHVCEIVCSSLTINYY